MKKRSSIERELNIIRLALYEEIKGMSSSEMTAYMKAQLNAPKGININMPNEMKVGEITKPYSTS